jgi:hypothetical protein
MYSTCLFCNESLGANEAIEHFPVGRRLAFDAAKGRLWVVCRKCERWNLTPLEERWEAIEECERAFRATKLRVSTDEIGLARLTEGLELVRIGAPQRPEMAGWRYGDQFGRRMRRYAAWSGAGLAGMAALMWGGPALGLYTGSAVTVMNLAFQGGAQLFYRRKVIARVRVGEGERTERFSLARVHVARARLDWNGTSCQLELPYMGGGERLSYTMNGLRHLTASTTLHGEDVQRAATQILPHVNYGGAGRVTVRDAVKLLDEVGSVGRCFEVAARQDPEGGYTFSRRTLPGSLAALPASLRLALEMASHEESERRALEGELTELHAAWRDAEEIAKIADDMFLPGGVESALARLKNGK